MRPERELVLGNRYHLVRPIAVGGMGEVWEAMDAVLSRPVAVKILKHELRATPAFIERFRAEARHAAGLTHPGIARVYDYGETAEFAYLVMELVPGQTLSELLVEQPNLPTATKLSILSQAAEALHAAHSAGVIHRDVKPGNLMVRPDGTVKVTDFGIARAIASSSLTDAGQVVGTAQYMSPEQATGGRVTPASDVYSLGVIAYEMFAGRRPFEADSPVALSMAHVHDEPPPLPPLVPADIAHLIRSSLAKDPAQRPPSAAAFAARARREGTNIGEPSSSGAPLVTAVQPRVAGQTVPSTHHVVASRASITGRKGRHRTEFLIGASVIVLLIVGIGWMVVRSGDDDDAGADTPPATDVAPAATSATVVVTPSPVTAPPTTVPTTPPPTTVAATAAPTTAAPSTAAPTTSSPSTSAPSTSATATTAPGNVPPVSSPTSEPVESSATTAGRVEEGEAIDFVVDYYVLLDAGEYETTWTMLTPEFREERDLTFEIYTEYWSNTTLALDGVTFRAGPGASRGRVLIEARYITEDGVIEETDELTLERNDDGDLVITDQRKVS